MTEKKKSLRALLAACVSIVLMGTALAPRTSFAQSGNVTLNINNCDDNNYPGTRTA